MARKFAVGDPRFFVLDVSESKRGGVQCFGAFHALSSPSLPNETTPGEGGHDGPRAAH
jgi:hypothetical protein